MQEIDRRNSLSKARRESVCVCGDTIHSIVKKKSFGQSQDDTDESKDGTPKLDLLSNATARKPREAPRQQLKKPQRSESIKPSSKTKLPPILHHAHSFNGFDHKRLDLRVSHTSDSSGSPPSLRHSHSQDDTNESEDEVSTDKWDLISKVTSKIQREAKQQQRKIERQPDNVKPSPKKKLPPISRDTQSFNEFDHIILSRQASQILESSGSQTSLNKRRLSDQSNSMFTLKGKPQKEAMGIISYVTGDLSIKLAQAEPRGPLGPNKGDFDLEEYLTHIPRSSKGTRKLRPLSADCIRVNKTGSLRRIKSANPAMVLHSLKPDISDLVKKQESIESLVDPKPMNSSRKSFQCAVMAVRATNRIQKNNKIWRV